MSTTSLKLSDALKQRALAAAEKKGVSLHALMVQAIELAASSAEREKMLSAGRGYDAREVHAYLKARIAGSKPEKPKAIASRD